MALPFGLALHFCAGCSFSAPAEDQVFGSGPSYRPTEGTYTYSGDSLQNFTLFGNPTEQHPSGVFLATIVHDADGCWRFRINSGVDPAPLTWEEDTFCARDGRLVKVGLVSDVRVESLGSETITTVACAPPDDYIRRGMTPSDSWSVFCTGSNVTKPNTFDFSYPFNTAGPYLYEGNEDVSVGARSVSAFHFHETRQLSGTNPTGAGSYSGTQETNWWFSRADGLPLKRTQTVDLTTDTGIPAVGNVLYAETSSWTLSALDPAPLAQTDGG
jgi:hypothetical protein